jgi:hypothetical protein
MRYISTLICLVLILSGCSESDVRPSRDSVYELLRYETFKGDMNRGTLFGPSLGMFSDRKFSRPEIHEVTKVLKNDIYHYTATVSFSTASPTKGINVTGEVYYFIGLDGDFHWQKTPWKQTGATMYGDW